MIPVGLTAMNAAQLILRVCCLGAEGVDVPIYLGPAPSCCKWIVVTRVADSPPADPVTYVVYFLDSRGIEIDFAQRDTLQEAIDTGKILSSVTELRWIKCRQELDESGRFAVVELQRICDDSG